MHRSVDGHPRRDTDVAHGVYIRHTDGKQITGSSYTDVMPIMFLVSVETLRHQHRIGRRLGSTDVAAEIPEHLIRLHAG